MLLVWESAIVHEAEARLFGLQREYGLSNAVAEEVLNFARWVQAETAQACGVSIADLPECTPLRKFTVRTMRKHIDVNYKTLVW